MYIYIPFDEEIQFQLFLFELKNPYTLEYNMRHTYAS